MTRPRSVKVSASIYREDYERKREQCPVFQLQPVKNAIVSLEDVRDIHEISQQVKNKKEREAIYTVNNMHMKNVEAYIHVVQYFERCLRARYRNTIIKTKPSKK